MVTCRGLSVGLTGNASTNAMVARAARSVLAAARQYAVMAAAAAEAAGEEDEEQQVGEASLGRGWGLGGWGAAGSELKGCLK